MAFRDYSSVFSGGKYTSTSEELPCAPLSALGLCSSKHVEMFALASSSVIQP